MTEVGIWKFASINPLTPEFSKVPVGTEVEFLPLENIWAYGKADYTERKRVGADSSYTQFRSGDILVPKVTPTVFHGRSTIAKIEGEVGLATSEVHVLRAKNNADPRWLTYQMLTARFLDQARGHVFGVAGLQRISAQYLTSYLVEDTPLETQRRIADYLDKEISEMDALIEEFEKLVESLETRKVLLIDKYVLGEPDVDKMRLAFFGEAITGITYSPHNIVDSGGTVVYRSGNVQSSRIDRTDLVHVNLEINDRYRFKEGDILMCSRNGSAKLVGKNALVEPEDIGRSWGAFMTVIRTSINDCLYWFYRSSRFRELQGGFATTTINQLTIGFLNSMVIPVPPKERRDEIVKILNREVSKMDALIEESTRLIENLKARKTALITEVVTGRKEV